MIVRNDNLQEVSLTQLPDYEVLYNGVFPGVLDAYPNAVGAWSLRRLKNDYSGSLIRLRRASDNAEQDFGFDGNGELDLISISGFCSGTDGYLTTWYDQSGNAKHATQSRTEFQHKVVTSGIFATLNGKPCIDATADILDPNNYQTIPLHLPSTVTFKNITFVGSAETSGVRYLTWGANGGVWTNLSAAGGGPGGFGAYDLTNYNFMGSTEDLGNQRLNWGQMKSSKWFSAQDGSAEIDKGTFASTMTVDYLLGRNLGAGSSFQVRGKIQEIVLWNTDQTSNKTGIEKLVNDYWQVY